MANCFQGLINSTTKSLYKDAIDALITDLGVTCELTFTGSLFESCTNCLYDPIGKKSANRFLAGGPMPFRNGQICPMCGGAGRLQSVDTEDVQMLVLWNYKDWIDVGMDISSPEGYRFTRVGEPNPAGLATNFIVTMWERAG
jgi:hypothetical protein